MSSSALFEPLQVGSLKLSHRIAMAPLTRYRCTREHVPLPIVAEYYAQRACTPGTLLISEATIIAPNAGGFRKVPGIYNAAQIAAWKSVTAAVHAQGSYIYCQLWALGRAAEPKVLASESLGDYVSSSAIPLPDSSDTPRPLTLAEIKAYISDYAQAARNAMEAGFDGVEIHAANGYLIDQFTQDTCNVRTDGYGGSVAKRSRFCVEVAEAVVEAVGAERVGIRLSPFSLFQGMGMRDAEGQFGDVVGRVKGMGLAYLHLVEGRIAGGGDAEGGGSQRTLDFAVEGWDGVSPVFLAGGFTSQSARDAVDGKWKGRAVGIAFGRTFISTPDLVFRVREGIDFNKYNRSTFYGGGPEGYVDYAFSEEWQKSKL